MMKVIPTLAALSIFSACAPKKEREFIFNKETLVSQSLPEIEYSIDSSKFEAEWQCFFSFDGTLEDAPDPNSEEIEGLRYSPILFYPKDTFLAVTTIHERLDDKQLTRLSFFCELRGVQRLELQPGHIYLFDSRRREVQEIGRFSSESSPGEISVVAKLALKRSIEQAEDLRP